MPSKACALALLGLASGISLKKRRTPEVLFITGTSATGYQKSWQAEGKDGYMIGATFKTFSEHRWNPEENDFPLRIYSDDSWDRARGHTTFADLSPHPNALVETVDVFEAEPWLAEVIGAGGAVDQMYAYAGDMEPCDQPLKVKSGKLLLRKLASMLNAVNTVSDGTVVIWLDTDVNMTKKPDETFLNFVKQHDINYIPFSSDRQWAEPPSPDFEDIESPYWRIESGVVALVANERSRDLLRQARDWYSGGLMKFAKYCEEDPTKGDCTQTWAQRNVYMDDIFAFSFMLHRNKHSVKQGWFHYGASERCGTCTKVNRDHHEFCLEPYRYVYSHTCPGQTEYTSKFNLEEYFMHFIGHGQYSQGYRESGGVKQQVDPELVFSASERFNSTLSFRLFGYHPERMHDEYWAFDKLEKRQEFGMYPDGVQLVRPSLHGD